MSLYIVVSMLPLMFSYEPLLQKSGAEEPLNEEPSGENANTPVDDGSGAAVQTDQPPPAAAADVTEVQPPSLALCFSHVVELISF